MLRMHFAYVVVAMRSMIAGIAVQISWICGHGPLRDGGSNFPLDAKISDPAWQGMFGLHVSGPVMALMLLALGMATWLPLLRQVKNFAWQGHLSTFHG